MMTDALTTKYAIKVPIDIISISVVMSRKSARMAAREAKKYMANKGICVFSLTVPIQEKSNLSCRTTGEIAL